MIHILKKVFRNSWFVIAMMLVFVFQGGIAGYASHSKPFFYLFVDPTLVESDFRLAGDLYGIPIYMDSSTDAQDVEYVISQARNVIDGKKVAGLKQIVFTHSRNAPAKHARENDQIAGEYYSLTKSVFIYTDRYGDQLGVAGEKVLLFYTLHELGHHQDLTVEGNPYMGEVSEQIADDLALSNMRRIGLL